jgi:hypothetical protein
VTSNQLSPLLPATYLQQGLWPGLRHATAAEAFQVRAVRITGPMGLDRLGAAIDEVYAALPALGVGLAPDGPELAMRRTGRRAPAVHDLRALPGEEAEAKCLDLLRAARGASTPVFEVVRLAADDLVVGLAAHRLVLDERSIYLVLGAVIEACRGRFRAGAYRSFTEVLDFRPLTEAMWQSRRQWWTTWLAAVPKEVPPVDRRESETGRMTIAGADVQALAESDTRVRHNGSLGVAALVSWWLQRVAGRSPMAGVASILDLRDYFGLGVMVGPLTDRMVFRVDLGAATAPSYLDVFRAQQLAVLRTATRYLPYGDLVALGVERGRLTAPRTSALWDTEVHLCRNPHVGAAPREEAVLGVAFANYREADLLDTGVSAGPDHWDGTNLDVRLSESGGDLAVVVDRNRLQPGPSVQCLLDGLGRAVARAVADPEAPIEQA